MSRHGFSPYWRMQLFPLRMRDHVRIALVQPFVRCQQPLAHDAAPAGRFVSGGDWRALLWRRACSQTLAAASAVPGGALGDAWAVLP
eukprot:11520950-Alexandrium_andersonii.AAC.1